MARAEQNYQLAAGVDAGSFRTRCVLCLLEDGKLRYLSHGLAPAAGWAKGRIVDEDALAESMRAAVTDAERGAHVPAEAVTLGIGGAQVRGANSRGLYEFGRPHELTPEDLRYAVELAADVRLERDRALVHVLPQDFTLDGRAGFRNPRKGICSRLEANVHIVTTALQEHQSLVAAAHLAHLAVEETVYEPVASAYGCLYADERARGVAVVNLGMHSTDLVIYDGEAALLASSIPVWADHMTRDIAAIFRVTYEDAECLKQEYGCALLGLTADSSFIEVPSPEGRPAREARRSELIEILEARAEELESPVWTTAAGLAMYSAKLKLRRPPRRRAGGLMGLVMR